MLKKLISMKPYQLFITFLLPFLISISSVIIIQSSLLYANFEKLALDMIYNEQKTALKDISRNINAMKQTARAISTQAFFDSSINDLLYSDVEPVDYAKYINKLESYKNIYPFLDSIYIYNGHNIYATPNLNFSNDINYFYDKEIIDFLKDMQNYKTHSIIPRRILDTQFGTLSSVPNKFSYVYSYLFYDSQKLSGNISEAIILNISAQWLWDSIKSSDNKISSRVFMIDDKQRLITNDSKYNMLSDLSDNNFVKLIQASNNPIGSLRITVDGVDSFITYVSIDALTWKLISITPYGNIVKDIDIMKTKTYLFVFCFLIAGVFISIFLSRRSYIPINSLIQNFNILESEKRNDFYYKKQEYLKSIVNNSENNLHLIAKQFEIYNIKLVPSENLLMILIKIDSFSNFCNIFNLEDRALMKYGMMNIISELLSPVFENECIDIDDDKMVALINYNYLDMPSKNEFLVPIVKDIQRNIEKYLNISLSFSFSDVMETLEACNEQYCETIDLSYYRLVLGPQALIFRNNLNILTDEFKYPIEKDKLLTDALLLEHISDAKKIFSEIIDNASQYSITILNAALVRILLSINNRVDIINSSNDINLRYNFNFYLSKLQQLEYLEEIKVTFFNLFESLMTEMKLKKDNKYLTLIEDVVIIVDREYKNHNLSLESISEIVNLSPSYLGRMFKKYKSISITNYINFVRLEKAKVLISETNDSINIIMDNLGFSSRSHFFTLFKKAYGITPNQYRHNTLNREENYLNFNLDNENQ